MSGFENVKLLGIDEVSAMLGVKKSTIYAWTSQNKIPHIKLSKRLLKFREQEIMAWIAQKSVDRAVTDSLINPRGQRFKTSMNDDVERIIRDAKNEILKRS